MASQPMWKGWREHSPSTWTVPPSTGVVWKPRPTGEEEQLSFIERITIKLPAFSGPADHLDYLALLDRCLVDVSISAHEADSLVALAQSTGISRTTCETLHHEYFEQLIAIAWADGVLADNELAQLVAVAEALGISSDVVESGMIPREAAEVTAATFALVAGDYIVLTGDMIRERDDWHSELTERGFVPWSGVTKKVKLVAAADPDSLSGKARVYSIPIVGEDGLRALLDRRWRELWMQLANATHRNLPSCHTDFQWIRVFSLEMVRSQRMTVHGVPFRLRPPVCQSPDQLFGIALRFESSLYLDHHVRHLFPEVRVDDGFNPINQSR